MTGKHVGIDIGGTKALFVEVGAPIGQVRKVETGMACRPQDLVREISRWLHSLENPPEAMGIAIPGLVSPGGEVVACDVLPGIVGWNPAAEFGGELPVHVVNDTNAALAESAHEIGREKSMVVVMVGTGIGAAIMANGNIVHGGKGWAGEMGSVPISFGRKVATLDELAGGAALLKQMGLDGDIAAERAKNGDPVVLRCVRRGGRALGLGLAMIINLLNPEVLILCGGTTQYRAYMESALKTARKYSIPELWNACDLRQPENAEFIVALGAARLAADLHT